MWSYFQHYALLASIVLLVGKADVLGLEDSKESLMRANPHTKDSDSARPYIPSVEDMPLLAKLTSPSLVRSKPVLPHEISGDNMMPHHVSKTSVIMSSAGEIEKQSGIPQAHIDVMDHAHSHVSSSGEVVMVTEPVHVSLKSLLENSPDDKIDASPRTFVQKAQVVNHVADIHMIPDQSLLGRAASAKDSTNLAK